MIELKHFLDALQGDIENVDIIMPDSSYYNAKRIKYKSVDINKLIITEILMDADEETLDIVTALKDGETNYHIGG